MHHTCTIYNGFHSLGIVDSPTTVQTKAICGEDGPEYRVTWDAPYTIDGVDIQNYTICAEGVCRTVNGSYTSVNIPICNINSSDCKTHDAEIFISATTAAGSSNASCINDTIYMKGKNHVLACML